MAPFFTVAGITGFFEREEEDDVEIVMREKGKGEKIVFMVNWERDVSDIAFGLDLPKGRYKMVERNLSGTARIEIGAKSVLTHEDLSQIDLLLQPQEVKVWYVMPEGKKYAMPEDEIATGRASALSSGREPTGSCDLSPAPSPSSSASCTDKHHAPTSYLSGRFPRSPEQCARCVPIPILA